MAASHDDARLAALNAAQRRAVTSQAATVAILAGPGSGKTHTLTSRVVWLVGRAGYRPADIVVATFTVKAAREIKARVARALGDDDGARVVVGTFHSIARRYLVRYGARIGLAPGFAIADDADSKAMVQRICKRLHLHVDAAYARACISKRKARGSTAAAARPDLPDLLACFHEYQAQLERSNLLDYDDLLVRCVELLRAHPLCVSNVEAVLVDEYQDTNGVQYDLMRLLAQARQRITIVGDPDQSIYGWRSAETRNLDRLLRDFPRTDKVSLEANYRSSQSILDLSLDVIRQDRKRYQKALLPVHARGATPVLRRLKSAAAEAEWIVAELRRAVMLLGGMLKYHDVAILLRSAALSRHIEAALAKAGVPYRLMGGRKFFDRKEIKVLLDYLALVHQPDNNDAVARVINVPRRGVGDATVKALLQEAETAKMSLWSLLTKHCRGARRAATRLRPKMEQKLSAELLRVVSGLRQKAARMTESGQYTLAELVEELVAQLAFRRYLEDEYAEDHEARWANVQELVGLAGDFARDLAARPDADALPEVAEALPAAGDASPSRHDDGVLGRFLANVALASDAQRDGGAGAGGDDASATVTLSTIHAAKGLEWPVVFVPSVYTGSIPHARADDVDEERRLLYVAMTRAQALLYLSCPLYGPQGPSSSRVELSPFVSAAAARFAQRGPSFDRRVVEATAAILGRPAPTEQMVFARLPPMFSPEDDAFPLEPHDPKGGDGPGDGYYARGPKRQRALYERGGGGDGEEAGGEERPWTGDYAVTTERPGDELTTASLPGFVSAGAHRTALAAAAAGARAPREQQQHRAGGTSRRQPDHKSLLGFLTREAGGARPGDASAARYQAGGARPGDASAARYQAAAARHASRQAAAAKQLAATAAATRQPAAAVATRQPATAATASTRAPGAGSGVDPALAQHRLPTGRVPGRPVGDGDETRERYACFSSPPPEKAEKADAEGRGAQGGAAAASRPATSLHTTTFMSAAARGAARRRVGLGAAPSMERLRRPFKPPTMKRPPGPNG